MNYTLIGELCYNGVALLGGLKVLMWCWDKFGDELVLDKISDAKTLIALAKGNGAKP